MCLVGRPGACPTEHKGEQLESNGKQCCNGKCRRDLRAVNPTWVVGEKSFCSRVCRATVTGEHVPAPVREEDAA